VHSCILASIASAAFLVTARGVQSIGQHPPGPTIVNAQSESLAQGESSDPAPSADAPCCAVAAAASAAVIGPAGAIAAAPVEGGGATGAACFPVSGVAGGFGAAFDGRLAATVVAAGAGASFDREAQPQTSRARIRARIRRRC